MAQATSKTKDAGLKFTVTQINVNHMSASLGLHVVEDGIEFEYYKFIRINLQGSQLMHVYLNTDPTSWSSFAP